MLGVDVGDYHQVMSIGKTHPYLDDTPCCITVNVNISCLIGD